MKEDKGMKREGLAENEAMSAQERQILEEKQRLEAILENVGCAICVKDDAQGKILFANDRFRRSFSKSIVGERAEVCFQLHSDEEGDGGCNEVYDPGVGKWLEIHYTKIPWVGGRQASLYTLHDITALKRSRQRIERQANNDFLTGLYNRMRCEQDLEQHICKARNAGQQGVMFYIDLDDFENINSGLGHRYGDILLKTVSQSLRKVRGIENSCYRMGGDEFVVIIEQPHMNEQERILGDVREIFKKPWFLKGAEYYCTMSMGIVQFPQDGETVQTLVKNADMALHEAKKAGKNRCVHYNASMGAVPFKRLDMETNMRNAANSCDEFEVYYQPTIDVTKPGFPCVGAEALLRWNSQSLGLINPMEFIPLAEYLGLINPIGSYVLRNACLQCKAWNDAGHPDYRVSVNLSVVQILQNDIVEQISGIIQETGVYPKNLIIEVTESLAVNDMDRMKQILGSLKDLGVSVALDDSGVGYSSLEHIRQMPVDIIKVDRRFIKDIGKDEFADIIVKTVSELANTIKMEICVEGVETEEQLEAMRKLGVGMVQGYYFDQPMSAEVFQQKYV